MNAKRRLPVAKNQHTVTKQYLRRWANSADQVHVYDLHTGRTRRENISNVATQRYFYSGPDGEQQVERALAKLEGFWINEQDRVLAQAERAGYQPASGTKVLGQPDKEQLADALVTQLVRTERVRRNFEHLGPEEAREAHAAFMTQPSVIALARTLENGIWLVRMNDLARTGTPLYTSDHPVCILPVDPDAPLGQYRVRSFMFPLSPAFLLAIYAPGTTQFTRDRDGHLTLMEVQDVGESNVLQLGSAERIVVSSNKDFEWARRWFTDGPGRH